MTPTKLLLGQMLVVAAIVVAGIWFATQWAAASLAYQPEFGTPWFRLGETPVYTPWSIFPWWFQFDAYAPVVFDEAGAIAAAGGLLGCARSLRRCFSTKGSMPSATIFRAESRLSRASARLTSGQTPRASARCLPRNR